MRAAPQADAMHREARRSAVVVEHPLLSVVEGEDAADPGAIADALELIVKWAVRAHMRRNTPREEVASSAQVATCGVGEPA